MDASSKIQGSIHDVRLTYKYVSRILGTYHTRAAIFLSYIFNYNIPASIPALPPQIIYIRSRFAPAYPLRVHTWH